MNAAKLAPCPGQGGYAITISGSDVDLTSPTGPTGGYCCRQVYVTGSGNLKYKGLDGSTHTVALVANQVWPVCAQYIFASANGTTVSGVHVIL